MLRTSQLDADRLDIEISALLREQFLKIFAHFRPVGPLSCCSRWYVCR